jgi:hypothetical protein
MENGNRIGTLSITPTVARQTPQNDFGTVLARTAQEVVRTGSGVVAAIVPGAPAVSAAVASVSKVVATANAPARGASVSAGAATGGTTGSASATLGATGQGDQWDLLAAQKEMQAEGAKMNLEYMNLQNQMQAESRAQNAISNIMKVRHDSAKAAINNIR